MSRTNVETWTTASVTAGSSLTENRALSFDAINITKVKVVPSLSGATSKFQLYQKDTFAVADIAYSSGDFAGTLYDPEELDAGVSTERNEGFVAVYEDDDASQELHVKVWNDDTQNKTYTVTIHYEIPIHTDSTGDTYMGEVTAGGTERTLFVQSILRMVQSSSDGYATIEGPGNRSLRFDLKDNGDTDAFAFRNAAFDDIFHITRTKNIGLGTATFGTSAAGVIALENASGVPSSSPTNMVQIYAEDVSASSELRVRDEAGNVTTLSPHTFELFTPDPGAEYPWSYRAENPFVGKIINVDMFAAIREIEALSGKQFIYLQDIPKEDWEANQQQLKAERQQQVSEQAQRKAVWETNKNGRLAALDALLSADPDNEVTLRKRAALAAKVFPERLLSPLREKVAPDWIAERSG